MCKILSRIKTLADSEGISIGYIERAIGASRGVISKAIAKGTDIQSKWLELICKKFPAYSPVWLLTGAGPMLRDDTAGIDSDSSAAQGAKIFTEESSSSTTNDAKIFTGRHSEPSPGTSSDAIIDRFVNTIRDLAEENGRLKERVEQLERDLAEARAITPRDTNPELAGSFQQKELSTI